METDPYRLQQLAAQPPIVRPPGRTTNTTTSLRAPAPTFQGPTRQWFDTLQEAQKQKAFTQWNTWGQPQRQAFLTSTPEAQRTQLQGIIGGQPAVPAPAKPPSGAPVNNIPTAPAPGTMGQVTQTPGVIGVQPQAGQTTTNANLVRQQLMNLLALDPNQIGENDPDVAPARAAYDVAAQRAADRQQSQLAEQAAFQGLGSGALATGQQAVEQQSKESRAAYNADLTMQALESRRGRLMEGLKLGAGLLTAEQENKLRMDIAKLDADIRRQGLAIQEKLGLGDLDLRKLLGMRELDLTKRGQDLAMEQFLQRLGFDAGVAEQNFNQDFFDFF